MKNVQPVLLGALFTGVTLAVLLTAFSLLVSPQMSDSTLLLIAFWYLVVPIIANLSTLVVRTKTPFKTLVAGILLFYAFVFLMTYKLTDTDWFVVMKYSLLSNLSVLFVYHYDRLFPIKSKRHSVIQVALLVGFCCVEIGILVINLR